MTASVAPHRSLRRALVIPSATLGFAVAAVLIGDSLVGSRSLLAGLGPYDRASLYKLAAPISASLGGFGIATISILIGLNPDRKVTGLLRKTEAFGLLVVMLLAAATYLLLTTVLTSVGAIFDDGQRGSEVLALSVEALGLAALLQGGLGGFLFAFVMWKIASSGGSDEASADPPPAAA